VLVNTWLFIVSLSDKNLNQIDSRINRFYRTYNCDFFFSSRYIWLLRWYGIIYLFCFYCFYKASKFFTIRNFSYINIAKDINSINTQWIHCRVVLSAILSKFKLLPAFALSLSQVSRQRITTEDIGSAYVSVRLKVDKEVKQNAVKMLNFIHYYHLKNILPIFYIAYLIILKLFNIKHNSKLRHK